MSWFDSLMPSRIKTRNKNPSVPDGLWKKCDGCNEVLYAQDLAPHAHQRAPALDPTL